MKSFLPLPLSLLLFPAGIFTQTTQVHVPTPLASAPEVKGAPAAAKANLAADYGKLPLSFEANQGQTDPRVRFLSRGEGYALFLTDKAAVLELSKGDQPESVIAAREAAKLRKIDVIRMELAGASQSARVTGAEELPGTANYFVGSDSSKWHSNVPTYARVKYTGVYPGVDLVYYGNQSQLEYDFVVAPKADPKPVQLHFAGADKLKLAANGDLIVAAKDGEIAFHKPVVYQNMNNQRQPVDGSFTLLAKDTVGFKLGSYDHSRELVIDPTLAYSTYLANFTRPGGIAVDASGSAYIAGSATVADFPVTSGSLDQTISTNAVFVAKFNQTGTSLVYSALIGGSGQPYVGDSAAGIAVDASGDAYVIGTATSADFPVTTGVVQTNNHAAPYGSNAFVLKLNPAGTSLLYSTYLGGSGLPVGSGYVFGDAGNSIAVDDSGNAYVVGTAYSTDFPISANAFQKTNRAAVNSKTNFFISKLNPGATALIYSTYLGGSGDPGQGSDDYLVNSHSFAVDSSGNVYLAGGTYSLDFPVTAGVVETTSPGNVGFITKLNPTGSGLVYSTYLGQRATYVTGLALDSSGDAYVAGVSAAFPVTSNAFQKTPAGNQGGAFVAKLNPTATGFLYATYLNGSMGDYASGLAIDASGDAYIAGLANSSDFPVTGDAYQPTGDAYASGFLTELNPAGSALLYSTYFGYSTSQATGVALDHSGNAYLAGLTGSTVFPTTPDSYQPTPPVGSESGFASSAFVSKFDFASSKLAPTTTMLSSSANPSIKDVPLTFTATVAPAAEGATPTGTVSFLFPQTLGPEMTAPVDSTGHATVTLTPPDNEVTKSGIYEVGAVYDGDSTYASSSSRLSQAVRPAPPVFSIPSGTTSSTPLVVSITATNAPPIYYTTDGSDPSNSTTAALYSGSILVSTTETIKAIVSDSVSSAVAAATYTITSSPGIIQFGQGFNQTSGLQLLGSASVVAPALELTDGKGFEAGAFYYPAPVSIQSFTTDFLFQLADPNADGFTFVLQNAGLSALYGSGSALGYAGMPKSVAVKFDLHDNAGEGPDSTGLYTNGAMPTVPAVNLTGTGIDLHSGHSFAAHITYDGTTLTLTITDTTTKATYSHSFVVDIPGAVGGNAAYVGFTGSTGGETATQSIVSWTYVPGPPHFPGGFGVGALGLIQNGNEKISGSALELTDGGQFETSSVFYSTPVKTNAFSTDFSFEQSNPNADGMTFTIQNTSPTALGLHGGALGYQGIGKSVAIKFDLHDDAGEGDNSTGIYIDGAAPTVPAINLNGGSGINLKNGHIFNANLVYDGTNLVLTITDTVTKKAFTHSFPIDIPTTVGGNTAYVGFTAATGFSTATQEILTWTLTNP